MIRLRPYYQGVDKIRLCPKATLLLSRQQGGMDNTSPFTAWGVYGEPGYFSTTTNCGDKSYTGPYWDHQAADYGSYGINNWIHDPCGTASNYWRAKEKVTAPSIVPALGDSVWEGTVVYANDPVPSVPGRSPNHDGMWNFCIPRHGLTVNWVFLDNSARSIPLKQLYKQKWSPTFDTNFRVNWGPAVWMNRDWGK
jgi:hypothetical protein